MNPNNKKYIREMKELTDYSGEGISLKRSTNQQKVIKENKINEKEGTFMNKKVQQEKAIKDSISERGNRILDDQEVSIKPYTTRDIILGVINLFSIIFTIILIVKLPALGREINVEKDRLRGRIENPNEGIFLSEEVIKKHEELNKIFLDEAGVVDFVNDIESLKSEGSSISKVSFTSQIALKDKTGNFGYPVVIEFRGSWVQISSDLEKIQKLPYLFRIVRFQSEVDKTENVIVLKYGGFLYVQEDNPKN